jgi:cobalt-precorrin-5B (C1)-methyltransferase
MRDPVSSFNYPDEWVDRCLEKARLVEVETGLSVLTSNGEIRRRGFTTGTTAAAACKSAVLSLAREVDRVKIGLPCGLEVMVDVIGKGGVGVCKKYPGDYPEDVTAGATFTARASLTPEVIGILFVEGVGRFSRNTARGAIGDPAVSSTAQRCICSSVLEAVDELGIDGVTVELGIENGSALGLKTLNPKMGVEGGISILGSTGLVEPWDDHLEESNLERIAHAGKVVLTTGRIGLRYSRLLFPDHEVVLVGSKMERAINSANKGMVLCGLPALILKFIDPQVLRGTGMSTVEELQASDLWAERSAQALARSKQERPNLRVVLVSREGKILGDSG